MKRRTEVSQAIGKARMASGGTRLVHSREMKVIERYSELGPDGKDLAMLLLQTGPRPTRSLIRSVSSAFDLAFIAALVNLTRVETMTAVEQIPDISTTPAWNALRKHHEQIKDTHLRQFFADDPDRGTEFTVAVGDLYIDYSKHRITRETAEAADRPGSHRATSSSVATRCSTACTSTSRRTARCCTPRCGCRATRS